jgi:hypothetical protein
VSINTRTGVPDGDGWVGPPGVLDCDAPPHPVTSDRAISATTARQNMEPVAIRSSRFAIRRSVTVAEGLE